MPLENGLGGPESEGLCKLNFLLKLKLVINKNVYFLKRMRLTASLKQFQLNQDIFTYPTLCMVTLGQLEICESNHCDVLTILHF